MTKPDFSHERFGAYRYSIEFAALAAKIIEKLPQGHAKLIDQFKRASISIPLNIAEGSGKTSNLQKFQCYAIARGEAMECAAILDVLDCMRMIEKSDIDLGKSLLRRIVSILTTVCKKESWGRPGRGMVQGQGQD